jgi:hypothetical protein
LPCNCGVSKRHERMGQAAIAACHAKMARHPLVMLMK